MEATKTERELLEMFSTTMNISVPSVSSDLIHEGILDSITLVDLLLNIENNFGFTVSLEDLDFDRLRTIKKIAEYIDEKSSISANG